MSNKPHSRSNLYRSRRRLDNSLRKGGSGNPSPESWSRPAVSGSTQQKSGFHLLTVSQEMQSISFESCEAGIREPLKSLSILVRPVPEELCSATYWVTIGDGIQGPKQAPIDHAGVAVPEISADVLQCAGKISVKWEFSGRHAVRVWEKV